MENLNFEINQGTEFQRMCHLLNGTETEMEFLKKLTAKELFILRGKFSDAMQNEHASSWEKLAAVAKFMPNFLNAKVSEDILGPSITANLTYHIPIRDALGISSHFSTRFMCDVAEHLIPSKLEALLSEFPIDRIRKIISELEKRKGYYTMGNFVDYIPIEKVSVLASEIKSDETLIRTGTFANKKDRLVTVIEKFSDERLKNLISTGSRLKLCEEILAIILHIPDTNLSRYIRIVFEIGGEVFSDYLTAIKKSASEKERIKNISDSMGLKIDWS